MATTTARSIRTKRQLRIGHIIGQSLIHAILIVVSFTCVMPFVWLTFATFKNYNELVSSYALLPKVWTLKNYAEIVTRIGFATAFWNSTLVAVPVTFMTVLTSTAVGFVFAKYHFWKKEVFFLIILSTMMVPFTVVIIPLFITLKDIGLVNQLAGIIVTGFWSTFGIFMLRQSVETIPNDYIDAGRIDGASEMWIFRQVIIPLSLTPMSALAVFTFLGSWDNFLWPSIVLKSENKQTLPLILAGLRNLFWFRYDLWATGAMVTVVPVMLLFTIAQRQFVRGLAMTGLKG
ncbi:MAG: carbohydrate ABC transporter permease [Anaerolineae bacterium]|nr:carbohydrate ABC transporter permease [Anaerolineae bacterium]